ncbi:hypothetical protein ATANTOWER_014252 [Ataeniobius toweri]|uniref:Uncharacterized protein n=1 Tax=Ataeniobius toweri TaxID=208326 RepID=A0ABU7BAU1_9TELE|nr:hypothetical protein [Ataeniobius toweri]
MQKLIASQDFLRGLNALFFGWVKDFGGFYPDPVRKKHTSCFIWINKKHFLLLANKGHISQRSKRQQDTPLRDQSVL